MHDFRIISIYGASSSGKSTVARVLEKTDSSLFNRIPADRLIKEKRKTDIDYFNKPIEYDWDYLDLILKQHELGDTVYLPDFDYCSFSRKSNTSDKRFVITSNLIIDAIAPYPSADYIFYINIPIEIRRQRMIDRDISQNTEIFKHWHWSIISDEYYSKKYADNSYILDGVKSPEELATIILNCIG